jgi:hypothetical protein
MENELHIYGSRAAKSSLKVNRSHGLQVTPGQTGAAMSSELLFGLLILALLLFILLWQPPRRSGSK